jgi:hypothetical protein
MYVQKREHAEQTNYRTRSPYRVPLPMEIYARDVGLGDALKHVTSAVGLKPCDGCERRAAALNRWVVFSAGRPDGR